MRTPPIVSPDAWDAARRALLATENAHTGARDALAAERRRMPWMAVEKDYRSETARGPARLRRRPEPGGRAHLRGHGGGDGRGRAAPPRRCACPARARR
ncbi:DUF899 family protein [Phenylobacterium sp. VNQ135]|uniref:DUF899 family protein n=1 Tax=Phenylobacterium sp. VNQ135 TaxID=3400922 RepID=UPI003C014195